MSKAKLKTVSQMMKQLDFCMLTTVDGRGRSSGRPMSNNRDVEYDGTSYFFTWEKSPMIKELKKNNNVSLAYISSGLMKKLFISVVGKAKLTKDKEKMSEHWAKDLEIYFKKGLKTPGIIMIEVEAQHIKYWLNHKEAEIDL